MASSDPYGVLLDAMMTAAARMMTISRPYFKMADNFTRTAAVEFLEGVLHIQSPIEKLNEDRVGFLNNVVRAFHERLPFQTVSAIATPKPERRRLTFEEIKACMMNLQGGLCWETNYFMKVMLERLGYEAYHVACHCLGSRNPTHLTTIVKNLNKQGDLHFTDVCTGFPVMKAIPLPLDFDQESPIYQNNFLTHRFLKDADGTYKWLHKHRPDLDIKPSEGCLDGWLVLFTFKCEFKDIEVFADLMERIRTVESGPEAETPLLLTLRAVDYRNGRLFAIKDTTVLEEDSSGKVNKKRVSGPDELIKLYSIHFPIFPVNMIRRAIQTVDLNFKS